MPNYSNPFSEKRNQGFALAPSQAEIKQAYRLVTADLYNSLLQMEANQTFRLPHLGKFTKREVRTKSGLDGQTYVFYRINFSPFGSLKKALNQSLENHYNALK
ncbi:MAG: hypothetical protein I3270_02575 [Candidatus Moeniiplasma glomeromycotorum]|nr:hypothetical protein [Candidatus Moeniiplasma glomeromycotorum]MCE8162568.1 hypothetical protein [Candidatus Moeniiplasma glomeromycotorum]MCE8166508.1 hypothetical protein [Candidatus Moeniiplasma glomeromycotorum]MCE8166951.1 hypothetical protein [Candidatus Moeniiplasma glomeromycotorum]